MLERVAPPSWRTRRGELARATRSAASDENLAQLEKIIATTLIDRPEWIPTALEIISADDFASPQLGQIVQCAGALYRDGRPISLPILADELERADGIARIARSDAALLIGQIDFYDAEESIEALVDLARRVRWHSLQRQRALIASRIVEGGGDERDAEELVAIERELASLEGPIVPSRGALGFTGEAITRALVEQAPQSPLPGLLDDQPSLHLVVGRPKIGKTTLALHIAISWACGVSPWKGAPALPGGRALIISAEQSFRRNAATLSRIAEWHPEEDRAAWPDRVEIVARDRSLSREARALFCLDPRGHALLRRHIERASRNGDPFGVVVLDSLSRLKPAEAEENSADHMTALIDPLAALATDLGVYVFLIHHEGHAERGNPVTAPRGSTSIAAIAQAVWRLEFDPQRPNERTLTASGNAIENSKIELRVAPESDAGKVLFFQPMDVLENVNIDEVLPPGAALSMTRLAEKLEGNAGGAAKKRARDVVNQWRRRGLVEVDEPKGKGHTSLVRRVSP